MTTYFYARIGTRTYPDVFLTMEAARQRAAAALHAHTARRKAFVDKREGRVLTQVAEVQRSDPSFVRWVNAYLDGKEPAREVALRRREVARSGARRP